MVRAVDIKVGKTNINFTIKIRDVIKDLKGRSISPREIIISIPVTGYHNVYNALAAFSSALFLGFDLKKIVQGLESFTGVPKRMDIIYDEEFIIIDDFAHNPASLKANFKTIKEYNYNNLVLHFLKGNRGVEANILNARVFSKWKKKIKIKELITTR